MISCSPLCYWWAGYCGEMKICQKPTCHRNNLATEMIDAVLIVGPMTYTCTYLLYWILGNVASRERGAFWKRKCNMQKAQQLEVPWQSPVPFFFPLFLQQITCQCGWTLPCVQFSAGAADAVIRECVHRFYWCRTHRLGQLFAQLWERMNDK